METARRLILTAILSVVDTGGGGQIIFGLLVSLIYLRWYAYANPYRNSEDSVMQEIAQYQVFFTLFLAFVMKAGPAFISQSTNISPLSVFTATLDALFVIVTILTLIFAFSIIIETLRLSYVKQTGVIRTQQVQVLSASGSVSQNDSQQPPPSQSLGPTDMTMTNNYDTKQNNGKNTNFGAPREIPLEDVLDKLNSSEHSMRATVPSLGGVSHGGNSTEGMSLMETRTGTDINPNYVRGIDIDSSLPNLDDVDGSVARGDNVLPNVNHSNDQNDVMDFHNETHSDAGDNAIVTSTQPQPQPSIQQPSTQP